MRRQSTRRGSRGGPITLVWAITTPLGHLALRTTPNVIVPWPVTRRRVTWGYAGALMALLVAMYGLAAPVVPRPPAPAWVVGTGAMAPDFRLEAVAGGSFRLADQKGRPVLLSFLRTLPDSGLPGNASRSQAVFLASMEQQYGAQGLSVVIVDATAAATGHVPAHDDLLNVPYDWHLPAIPLLEDEAAGHTAGLYDVRQIPTTFLVSPNGRVLQRWNGLASPASLAMALDSLPTLRAPPAASVPATIHRRYQLKGVSGPVAMKATATYYVDCVHGNDHRSGRSAASAWQTLSRVNSVTFRPGNEILLLRGTRCMGMLRPRGSGSPGAPIVISAYGAGPLPIISAGDHTAALELFNQSHWEISNLETMGGTKWGIHIGGDRAYTVLHHFRITNVVVHDVTGTPTNKHTGKHTGLIVIEPGGDHMTLDDVVVDGATAYNTTQWAGIMVGFSSGPWYGAAQPLNTNLVVRNSTVHDVAGDGIVIHEARHALTEHNVAYNTGKIVTSRIGTPNAIWDWQCHSCIVRYNEAYHSHSPAKDGGDYDIDYLSQDQTVEYNYGHDSQGYCLAVFGADNSTTTNSVLRYNICANDAQNATWSYQGDVKLETWGGGRIDGVKIYNNTFYWHPAADHALLNNSAVVAGTASRVLFENNLIYATVPAMVTTADKSITLDHNLYWYTGKGAPVWTYNGVRYEGFAAYRRGSGQDAHGIYANPDLTSPAYHAVGNPARAFALKAGSPAIDRGADIGHMGGHDFANTPVPHGHGYDIGALESPYARSSGHRRAATAHAAEALPPARQAIIVRRRTRATGTWPPWASGRWGV